MCSEELDVSYGAHHHHKMDIYFPDGHHIATPVVFLIHGGGFIAGFKEQFTAQAKLFRDEGFITVNLSHRLIDSSGLFSSMPKRTTTAIRVADQVEDLASAVTHFCNNANKWGCSSRRAFMAGHSAGAILSLLYTLGVRNENGHIRAAGNWAGVTDLSLLNNPAYRFFTPSLRAQIESLYHRALGIPYGGGEQIDLRSISPYWLLHNSKTGYPVISIYPEHNSVLGVPGESAIGLELTRHFHNLLHLRNIPEKLSIYQGSNHSFSTPANIWKNVIQETATWFKQF
jgi:acetyl esterase/lipase